MQHKKMKTEPCLSPESPFMRKPSKEFLQKLAFNKGKFKDQEKNMLKSSEYFNGENIQKISFIPCGTSGSMDSIKNNSMKLKKTTIDLEKFKIRHENLLLKNDQQELRQKNAELMDQNRELRKQIEVLRKQLESESRISKISGQTLEPGDDGIPKKNTLTSFESQESLLQIQNYEIMPTTIQVSHVNSLVFDEEMRFCEDECNFLSTSIGKKPRFLNEGKENKEFNQKVSFREEIEILQNRITYLEKGLQSALIREKQLENTNKRLQLSASMSQRKLDMKESELKEIRKKDKQKKYLQKLYELSSEEDLQAQ